MIEFYTIALIAILAAISPGPDFVIVAKNAISYNRRSAVMTSLGVSVGILVHATYCILGLAVVISQSLLLFSLIKYLGASYLIYLGIKSLLSKNSPMPEMLHKVGVHYSLWSSFKSGLLTNVLNPKCTLFMLSVFTLVIKPHTSMIIQIMYGLEISLIVFAWFLFLSCSLTCQAIKTRIEKVQQIVSKCIGVVLIAIGIAVVYER